MSNHQGNTNANANMRWGHGAAPDGTWEYGWAAGSFPPGGPTFAYASASASASASAGSAAGSGFGFRWGSGAAASGSAASSGPDHNHNHNHNQHGRSGQPFMHRPDYGASFYNSMPFREFPMGPVFGPPRSTYNNGGPRYDRRGRGGHGGGAGFTRYF